MRIELFRGKGIQPWFIRLVAANGQTITVSEGYFSKHNAKRAARKALPDIPLVDATTLGRA
jgi:uncharacterized protein YegP (UPF0339 family)